jgi:hypothetical protein
MNSQSPVQYARRIHLERGVRPAELPFDALALNGFLTRHHFRLGRFPL